MWTRLRIIVNYGMGYVIRNITDQSKDDVGVVFVCRKAFSQLDKISATFRMTKGQVRGVGRSFKLGGLTSNFWDIRTAIS